MWLLNTEKGLRQIRLVDLKFYTQVKGWVCQSDGHLYNFNNSKNIGFVSNTICNGITSFKFNQSYESLDGNNINFDKKFGICHKENCYCGMDIGIPKGKTFDDIETLKKQYQIHKKSLHKIPYYNNETILSFGLTDFIDEKIIHVDWFLGRRCNFDCVYCPPTIHDSTSSYPDFKKLQKDYKFLTDIIIKRESNIKNKIINYILAGGEPTLIPCYLDFLEMIINDDRFNSKILTLTNLTGSLPKLYKLNTLSNVTFSVHLHYMTEKFIDKIDNFLSIRDKKCKRLNVKFMYDREYNHRIAPILDVVKKYDNLDYEVMALHNKGNQKKLYEYNEYDKEFFRIKGSL